MNNADGNTVALKNEMAKQDKSEEKQKIIDELAEELMKIHKSDTDDMIEAMIEKDSELALVFIRNLLKKEANAGTIQASQAMFDAYIEMQCIEMAERQYRECYDV